MQEEIILSTDYLVYAAYVDDVLVYIGSGLSDRPSHCTSGRSHVTGLNEALYQGKSIRTEVLRDELSKGVSIHIERELIKKFLPEYNKTHNAFNSQDNLKRKLGNS